MPVEHVIDDSGDAMTLLRYHEDRYGASDFLEESLVNSRSLELRSSDVMLCSYSKSGCHWMSETLRILQMGTVHIDLTEKEKYMLEFNTAEQLASLPSPRVLNNHLTWDAQPRDLLDKKVKVVFFYRNPKDVAVSFFHHHRKFKDYAYSGNFHNYLRRLAQGKVDNGNPFRYLREWEAAIASHPELPVFVGCYEDMKEKPLSELRRLATFLGHQYNDDFLHEVIKVISFDSMKQRKGPISCQDDQGQSIIYRRGDVGDWKNHFTEEQSQWFDDVISQEMAGSRLQFRYALEECADDIIQERNIQLRHSG